VPDDSILFSCLPFPNSNLRATTRAFPDFDVSVLTPEELAVLRVAREGADLTTILSEVGGDAHNVLRLCGALSVLGFLELETNETGQEDITERITTAFAKTENMTESQILEVNPGAERGVIERAYTLKRLEWTQMFELVKGHPELEYKVLEIQFRFAAAYHRLLIDGGQKILQDSGRPEVAGTEASGFKILEEAEKGTLRISEKKDNVSVEKKILNTVKAHFKAKNWDAAIPLLSKLVEMAPQNAAYRGFLAKAMFKHPTMRSNAEAHFLEAIQLTPLDPKLHMWLGLYYKSSGQALRAATAFRTALELDPENSVAKRYFLTEDSEGHIVC
jgi:tetratricopeptide (TPR) repeat protein